MLKKTVLTVLFLFFAFGIFGSKANASSADCIPASNAPGSIVLSCRDDTSVRCPVRRSEGAGGALMCCPTTKDCVDFAEEKDLHTGVSVEGVGVCGFTGDKSGDCESCVADGTGSWTAFGCIPADPSEFFKVILQIGMGIGGGVAFLLILLGGFQILTSAGNPEQLTAGRELVSSAITGLLLIIFSVFILRLIGVEIFGIPGLT